MLAVWKDLEMRCSGHCACALQIESVELEPEPDWFVLGRPRRYAQESLAETFVVFLMIAFDLTVLDRQHG